MKTRKIVSIILILLGVGVFLFSMYAKTRIMEVRKSINNSSGLLPDSAINKQITKALDAKVGSYDMPVLLGMIGGIVLIVVGVGSFVYRKKR